MSNDMSRERVPDGRIILLILSLAFLLRLFAMLLLDTELRSDPLIYHDLALSLLEEGTYSFRGVLTAYRPPGYPFFLSGLYYLAGSSTFPVRLAQSILDTLTVFLVYRLGRSVFSDREGLVAAFMLAVFVPYILYSQTLFSETLFTFLFVLLLVLLAPISPGRKRDAAAGLALGLCSLLKPVMVIFPAALFLVDRLSGSPLRRSLERMILISLLTVLVVTPWLVRNRWELGSWIFTTNGGVNFWIGNNPRATGAYHVPEDSSLLLEEDEVKRNRIAYVTAWEFLKDQPLEAVKLLPWKFFFLFSSESAVILNLFEEDPSGDGRIDSFRARYLSISEPILLLVNLPYYILVLLSLPALVLAGWEKNDHRRILLLTVLLFWIFVHLAFFGSNRFHMPIMAVFAIFAARSLLSLRGLPGRISGLFAIVLAAVVLLFVVLWLGEWVGLLFLA